MHDLLTPSILPTAADIEQMLLQHLQYLCVEIGPRLPGSQAHKKAAAYIRDTFQKAGLQGVDYESPFIDWQHQSTILTLPDDTQLAAYGNTFSPACDVTAPLLPVCTVAELETAEMNGRIALLYGDLTKDALIPKNYKIYQMDGHQQINKLLQEKSPLAILTTNIRHPAGEQIIQDMDLALPSATIPETTALRLLSGTNEPIHLQIDATTKPSQVTTIIGRRSGQGKKRIVLMAHYDTKVNTPGAVDNGSGTAVALTLAQLLKNSTFATDLEFVIFPDEEYYGLGDLSYIAHHEDDLADILVAINVDGAGYAVGTNTITAMSHEEDLQKMLEEVIRPFPALVWVDPWPQSNHSTFAYRGVPSIAISSTGAWEVAHTPHDTIERVNPAKLREIVEILSEIINVTQKM